MTGLSEKPFRARPVEERLRGNKLTPKLIEESAAQVAEGSDPLEDLHASGEISRSPGSGLHIAGTSGSREKSGR